MPARSGRERRRFPKIQSRRTWALSWRSYEMERRVLLMERPCRQFRAAVALRMRRYCTMAARSRRQPENEMLRPFRAYRHTILCRDLRPQSPSSYLAFRTVSEGDIEAPGLATRGRGKDGLE